MTEGNTKCAIVTGGSSGIARAVSHPVPDDIASGKRDYRTTIDWS
jgi:NADP-dependent 3-hydroxy acid dehydrogenase YdfG